MRLAGSRATIAALTLAVVMALAACDESDGPSSPSPSDTPSVPESSSPTEPTTAATETGPVEPTLPAEAEKATRVGVKAFVSFYWTVVNYSQQTGDVRPLKEISDPSCGGCNGGIEYISKVYRRGGRIIGGDFALTRAVPGRTPSGAWHVAANVHVGRSRTAGAGDLDQVSRAGELEFLFGLRHLDGAWHITFLDTQ